MMRKVYLHARYELKPGDPEPDFRSLFSVMEARRMGRLLKRAVWTASEALKEAGIDVPDAVIIGTDYGCIENSEAFLKALKGIDDAPMKPTHFMQSTHNTISSLIAIRLLPSSPSASAPTAITPPTRTGAAPSRAPSRTPGRRSPSATSTPPSWAGSTK